ncbi:MAG: response regulator [Gammaproteobacteria bacterium]|nr:response regulator [Gammaproteobacteria bacterium]
MKTILVVDDEADIALTLQAFVELHGFRVVVAYDGVEALQKALSDPPDLIVTDVTMPRMNGLELVEKLRESAAGQDIPVILISARDYRSALPYFRKPFDPNALIEEIRRLLP